jgi:hypothetical protein
MANNGRVRVVREAVKWVTSAFMTKVIFDKVASPMVATMADVVADAVQPCHMLAVPADHLMPPLRNQLAKHCVLVIGPPKSGKSSLLRFVEHGTPRGRPEGRSLATNAEFRGIVAEARMTREVFAETVAAVRPHAVLYLLDPRGAETAINPALDEIRAWVLPVLAAAPTRPQAFHVGLNFVDRWGESSGAIRRTRQYVEDGIVHAINGDGALSTLRIRASEMHLRANASAWPQVLRALDNLGADLS